jgi:hypothetical protein
MASDFARTKDNDLGRRDEGQAKQSREANCLTESEMFSSDMPAKMFVK